MNERLAGRPDPRIGSRRPVRVERGLQEHTYPPNRRAEPEGMGDLERLVSGVGGAAALWYGLQQEGISRWSLAVLGAGLVYQGVSGDNLLDRVPLAQENPILRPLTSAPTNLRVRKSLTINRPAGELYSYWRKLENLPTFMHHVKSVRDLGEGRSHWVVEVISNMELEWDARITEDRPDEMLAWETLPDAQVQNRGYVKFIPTARGTEVSVSLEYDPPGALFGRMAGGAVKFIAEQQIKEEIRTFKRLMETGEVPTTKGQPAARDEAWQESQQLRAQSHATQSQAQQFQSEVYVASSEMVTVEESRGS